MSSPGSSSAPAQSVPASPGEARLWRSLDQLLARADVAGARANKLGALAAHRLRELGAPVPGLLEDDARLAALAWIAAIALLRRIRSIADGPLLVLKGPELAALYPSRARAFTDVDLLSPSAKDVHTALLGAGFVEVGDPELFVDHHHLRPLQLPGIWLKVEIHSRPMWPDGLTPPSVDEIVAAAVPSATAVEGIAAPAPAHHAVILASHAWVHEPLHTLRDLADIVAIAEQTGRDAAGSVAEAWGLARIWRTTDGAANALLGDGRPSVAVRIWGRHLPAVRERSVLDNHLQRWLHSFWELPFLPALRAASHVFWQEILPDPGESWRDKLARVTHAFTHPRAPLSAHARGWLEARRRRGGGRKD